MLHCPTTSAKKMMSVATGWMRLRPMMTMTTRKKIWNPKHQGLLLPSHVHEENRIPLRNFDAHTQALLPNVDSPFRLDDPLKMTMRNGSRLLSVMTTRARRVKLVVWYWVEMMMIMTTRTTATKRRRQKLPRHWSD